MSAFVYHQKEDVVNLEKMVYKGHIDFHKGMSKELRGCGVLIVTWDMELTDFNPGPDPPDRWRAGLAKPESAKIDKDWS